VVGDFNRDGNADLAVVMGNSSTIAVFLGHGDGTFAPAILNSQTAAVSYMLVVADFNGDGIEDLAVENSTSSGSGSISILLGNGDGTFNASTVVASGIISPADLVKADFNGDGIPDLAFVNGGVPSSVVVLLGNGDGTFKTLPAVSTPGYLTYIAVGDFNQDGKPDIFAFAANGATTLLGNGDGTFSAAASAQPIISPTPQGIVVADFNGDGKPDIALLFQDVSTVYTLPGNGDGTFGAAVTIPLPAGAEPSAIVAGDWNGDGIPDLATANENLNSITSLTSLRTQQVTATATNIAAVGVGQHLVDAAYSGDSDYTGSISGTIALSGPIAQTISFPQPTAGSVGEQMTLTATASSGLPVTFSILSGPATLSGTNNATITYTAAGTVVIEAIQSGNGTYSAATPVTQSFSVTSSAQTITFGVLPTTAFTSTPPALNATASSGLTVSYASTTQSVCTVTGGKITFVTAGTCTVTASQPGNTSYAAATPVTQSFAVTATTQTITFAALPNTTLASSPLTLTATASSGLTVSYTSTTSSVCSVSGSTLTLIAAGTCSITASQAGNTSFAAATSVTQSFTVTSLDFTMQVFGASTLSVSSGSSATYTLAVAPSGGSYPGTVSFAVTGLPTGAAATVSPTTLSSTSGAQTVSVTVSTVSTVASNSSKGVPPWSLALLILPLVGLRYSRKRIAQRLCLLLMLAIGGFATGGCSSNASLGKVASGSYPITITGTSGTVQHVATVTLIVQ